MKAKWTGAPDTSLLILIKWCRGRPPVNATAWLPAQFSSHLSPGSRFRQNSLAINSNYRQHSENFVGRWIKVLHPSSNKITQFWQQQLSITWKQFCGYVDIVTVTPGENVTICGYLDITHGSFLSQNNPSIDSDTVEILWVGVSKFFIPLQTIHLHTK